MRSVNKVIIIGNLTRNPEMRKTPNGQSVTTFGIATNREWTTKSSEKKNSAEFHECVAWARLAEICDQYLQKGQLVYIEGYLKTRSWDSPEGIKKFKTEIVVKDMIRLEKKSRDGEEMDYIPEDSSIFDGDNGNSGSGAYSNGDDDNGNDDDDTEKEEGNKNEDKTPSLTDDTEKENPIDKDLGL